MADDLLPPREENVFPIDDPTYARDDLFSTVEGDELRSSIERLYEAFASRALGEDFAACPHCFTDEDIAYLKNTPLRQLSYADAAAILPDSVYTLGTAKDLNYFLPRLLETWAHNAHYMEFTIPGKLELARQGGWTQAQEQAVGNFIRAMYRAANDLAEDWPFRDELASMAEALKRQFPEIAQNLQIELRE